MSPPPTIDLEDLGFDRGAHLLLKHALDGLAAGERLEVRGRAPELAVHLRAWCRQAGHGFDPAGRAGPERNGDPGSGAAARVRKGPAAGARVRGATRAGDPASGGAGVVTGRAPARWGLAARGALVEAGGPELRFALDDRATVWADSAAAIYRQAAAAQWDPATAVDWEAPVDLPPGVEAAVVQVMTYLIENENAALVVPARFLARSIPTSARCSGSSPCRWPTRPVTSRSSPGGRG
jgi:hypothetical protein